MDRQDDLGKLAAPCQTPRGNAPRAARYARENWPGWYWARNRWGDLMRTCLYVGKLVPH